MDIVSFLLACGYAKNGAVTEDTIKHALGYTPAKNVHLWSDGTEIFYFEDKETQENPLTYLQIKEIVENEDNNVYLTNGYFSFYGKYLYRPGIAGENAIGFAGTTQLEREDGRRAYDFMIVIHEDNSVTAHEIRLARHSDVEGMVEDVAALKAALVGVSDLIGGDG